MTMTNIQDIPMLPQAPESEIAVVATAMGLPGAFTLASAMLSRDDFRSPQLREIYGALEDMHAAGKTIDPDLLTQHMRNAGTLESVGGIRGINEIAIEWRSLPCLQPHIEAIKEASNKRQLLRIAAKTRKLSEDPSLSTEKLRQIIAQELAQIQPLTATRSVSVRDTIQETIDILEARPDDPEKAGIKSGIPALDELTGGFHPGQLIVIGARTSVGKSAFGVNIIQHAAESGYCTAIFSLEMEQQEIKERMLAAKANIDSGLIRKGRYGPSELSHLRLAANSIALLDISIWGQTEAVRTVGSIESRIMQMTRKPAIILVDYLQLLDAAKPRENRVLDLSEITRHLKLLAGAHNVAIIALAQLSREADKDGVEPQLKHLRESGSIENDANTVILIHRPQMRTDTSGTDLADLIVAKARSGRLGVAKAYFRQAVTQFVPA